jgi:Uma2 family endonuclease
MRIFATPTDARAVEGPPQGQWTYDDWIKLDTEGNRYRYEVIDGVLYVTYVPPVYHQHVLQEFMMSFGFPFDKLGEDRYTLTFCATIMAGVIVVPDFVACHPDRIKAREYLYGIPDLITEILYPGDPPYDEGIKLNAYARAGVPEYVVIDPDKQVVRYYRLNEAGAYDAPIEFDVSQSVQFDCAPSIVVHVGALFEDAPNRILWSDPWARHN